MRRRLALIGLAILALAGCQKKEDAFSPLYSESRILNEADEAGAPGLKAGVWATRSKGCDYDPNVAPKAWPECVRWMVVADHQRRWPDREEPETFLLGGGDPRLLQASGVDGQAGYQFWGLRSAGVDAGGRIVKFRIWPVSCDPLAAPVAVAGETATPQAEGEPEDCAAKTVADLRRMTKESEPEEAPQWIWIRDRVG